MSGFIAAGHLSPACWSYGSPSEVRYRRVLGVLYQYAPHHIIASAEYSYTSTPIRTQVLISLEPEYAPMSHWRA